MKAKEYFDKEYGTDHIKDVVDLKDMESLYGLMQEYADEQLRLHIVSKSFTAEDVVNELEDSDHLDDAIQYFKEQIHKQ